METPARRGGGGDRIRGVVFQSKAGRRAILADVVIDATGDGDVLASAGCATEQVTVHPWLWFRMGGVADVEAALDAGRGFFRTPNPGVVLFPWGSMASLDRKIDPTDPRDLTFAEVECRRLVMEEVRKLFEGELRRLQSSLAVFEKVRAFEFLQDDPSEENGLLTPTQKVRRSKLTEQYRGLIDAMYER